MCDYSLYEYRSRLAKEGEMLVSHRFGTGSIGFVSQSEAANSGLSGGPCAVCIPHGSTLRLSGIPKPVSKEHKVPSEAVVTLVQLGHEPYRHRDAVLFENGRRVLLQQLGDGVNAAVLTLEPRESEVPSEAAHEEHAFVHRR
jgi:hypothetical protein